MSEKNKITLKGFEEFRKTLEELGALILRMK